MVSGESGTPPAGFRAVPGGAWRYPEGFRGVSGRSGRCPERFRARFLESGKHPEACRVASEARALSMALDRRHTSSYARIAMRRLGPQGSLVEFLTAVFLLGVITPAQATLCVAAGGHLAVEPAGAVCCHTDAPTAGTALRGRNECGEG